MYSDIQINGVDHAVHPQRFPIEISLAMQVAEYLNQPLQFNSGPGGLVLLQINGRNGVPESWAQVAEWVLGTKQLAFANAYYNTFDHYNNEQSVVCPKCGCKLISFADILLGSHDNECWELDEPLKDDHE